VMMDFPGSRVSDREFRLFQALVLAEGGIYLADSKRALLQGRLARRLRDLRLRSLTEYYAMVQADPEERVRLLDAITTNETHFFREPAQLKRLAAVVFPDWREEEAAGRRPRAIRVWSAGCSTGEEPYSLAMLLLDHFPPVTGWRLEIVATDLSTRVLDRARAAVWPLEKSKDIPADYRRRFMLRGVGSQSGLMKAGPEIRALISFARLNLNDGSYAAGGPFDLVLCRNVLIYFQPDHRLRVIERLVRRLTPRGYLCLGHAESLAGTATRLATVGAMIYSPVARSLQ
jgi:chemotaxis protein methyltransferase CheR